MAELPAGYTLDAPAQSAALPAGYTLDGQSAPKSSPVSLWGLLKSAGSGLARGAEAGASALGQAADIEQNGGTGSVPDAKQTQDILDKEVGKPYEPQNAAERMTHAGFAAVGANPPLAAMTGIPSTIGAGVASEGAHELLKDSPLDMPGQIIAPLLMGKALNTARSAINGTVKKITANPSQLSSDDLYASSKAGFKQLDNSDLELHPTVGENWSLPMSASLEKRGLDSDTAPITTKVLDGYIGKRDNITATDILKTRSKLGELSNIKDAHGMPTSEAKAASDALDSFDDLVTNPQKVPAGAVMNGDLGAFQSTYKNAAGDWGAARRMDRWDGAMNDAENNAAVANSGANAGNAMRTAAKRFDNGSAKAARGMNDDETDAIQNFIRGSGGLNRIRDVGNLLGGGKGIAAGASVLAGIHTGDPLLVAAPALGAGARWLYNNRTAQAADDISQMLATRSPLAQSQGANLGIQNLLGAARAMHLTERVARAARGPEGVWGSGQ